MRYTALVLTKYHAHPDGSAPHSTDLQPGEVLTRSGASPGWIRGYIVRKGRRWPDGWVRESALRLISPAPPKRLALAGRIIVNDIGHGLGNRKPGVMDPGAVSGGFTEHALAEIFVGKLSNAERALGASVTVSQDTPLRYRKADAIADATSWHLNAGGGTGVEVWVPWGAGSAARAKATRIGLAIAHALDLPWRGIKRSARLSVLNHGFDRLVELGFIDNPTDRARFEARIPAIVEAVVATI